MYFSRSLYANTSSSGEMERQWRDMWARRTLANNMEQAMFEQSRASGMQVNAAAIIPRDVYQELDSVTTRIFREDDGDTIMNDMMPMSRAVNIGKIEYKFRRASDSGNAVTSLSGQGVIGLDKAQYSYDGTVIPVHQDGYGREWRELEGQRSEMFDGLIDDQENSVRAVRRKMVDWILDGDTKISGPSGQTWGGIDRKSVV